MVDFAVKSNFSGVSRLYLERLCRVLPGNDPDVRNIALDITMGRNRSKSCVRWSPGVGSFRVRMTFDRTEPSGTTIIHAFTSPPGKSGLP